MIQLVERRQAVIDGILNDRSRRLVEVLPVAEASWAIKALVCRLGVEQYVVISARCTAFIQLLV